jgi:hypothetical protein
MISRTIDQFTYPLRRGEVYPAELKNSFSPNQQEFNAHGNGIGRHSPVRRNGQLHFDVAAEIGIALNVIDRFFRACGITVKG